MNKDLVAGLMWGGGLVALALAATLARKLGFIEAETVTRLVIGSNGLMIAWYGNRMPKAFAPSAMARRITRVAGWSFVLSGLVYALLWAFAPVPVAVLAGCSVIVAGMAVTLVYAWSLRSGSRSA
jgi:uncharacterized membrane protein